MLIELSLWRLKYNLIAMYNRDERLNSDFSEQMYIRVTNMFKYPNNYPSPNMYKAIVLLAKAKPLAKA